MSDRPMIRWRGREGRTDAELAAEWNEVWKDEPEREPEAESE